MWEWNMVGILISIVLVIGFGLLWVVVGWAQNPGSKHRRPAISFGIGFLLVFGAFLLGRFVPGLPDTFLTPFAAVGALFLLYFFVHLIRDSLAKNQAFVCTFA